MESRLCMGLKKLWKPGLSDLPPHLSGLKAFATLAQPCFMPSFSTIITMSSQRNGLGSVFR